MIAIGFLAAYAFFVHEKIQSDTISFDDEKFPLLIRQAPNSSNKKYYRSTLHGEGATSIESHQQQATDGQPKAVSYCMIDGRLIDKDWKEVKHKHKPRI